MSLHPASRSIRQKVLFVAAVVLATGGLWAMLAIYCGFPFGIALADSAVYMLLLSGAGYFYWYVEGSLTRFLHRTAVALVVQIMCVGIVFAVVVITGVRQPGQFSHTIPLHLIYGLLLWVALSARYRVIGMQEAGPSTQVPDSEDSLGRLVIAEELQTTDAVGTTSPKAELIDRISVKKGAQIEIIPVGRIAYIQAYGDYVLLHTEGERHIKEQTLKFYETSLPGIFVRIHRSFIVNTDYIALVELAGKESYTIKLKNGVAIRASAAGYKLLKQRLSL